MIRKLFLYCGEHLYVDFRKKSKRVGVLQKGMSWFLHTGKLRRFVMLSAKGRELPLYENQSPTGHLRFYSKSKSAIV